MNSSKYKNKYFKYKNKYLKLKYGGNNENCENNINKNIHERYKCLIEQINNNSYYNNYLNNIIFTNNDNNNDNIDDNNIIKQKILYTSFKGNDFLKLLLKQVETNINSIIIDKKTNNWIDCLNTCYNNLSTLSNEEIKSTAYVLKCISESIINNNIIYIYFNINNLDNLKGIWDNDHIYFKINKINKICNSDKNNCDLIMGFGPSASGKTIIARNIIDLLHSNGKINSNQFISIDGGNYRSSSIIYKIIKLSIRNKNFLGIHNLISPNFFIKKIFNSDIVKDYIFNFLKNHNIYFNLYVPDTLSNCALYFNCYKNYDKFFTISNNNWIGLLIWQHIEQNSCNFIDNFKCKGCSPSGKERELEEGKKYSSSAYNLSMINGRYEFKNATKLKYEIHNSGTIDRKSLLIDYNDNKLTNTNNFTYVEKVSDLNKYYSKRNFFNIF